MGNSPSLSIWILLDFELSDLWAWDLEQLFSQLFAVPYKTPPKDLAPVQREVQEIKDALQAFESAVASGEMIGQQDNAIRSHGGT